MTTAITLARAENRAALLGLVERRQSEAGAAPWADDDRAFHDRALAPLTEGGPEGAAWLIGPVRAPLGYAIVSFGWSLDAGGRVGWLEDIYIRPSVRRRGIAREVIHAIGVTLRRSDVRAIRIRLPRVEHSAQEFCIACGFALEAGHLLLSDS